MVDQILPQWAINQLFTASASATTRQLRALVLGPAYRVQLAVALGAYAGSQVAFPWPNKQAGDIVDQAYTSVELRNAAQRYSLIPASENIGTVAGKANRLKASVGTFNWVNNGLFSRAAEIPFDPVVGDWVRVNNGSAAFVTSIVGFDGSVDPNTPIPGVGGPGIVAVGGSNVATQGAASTLTPHAGNTSVVVATPSAVNYAGQGARAMHETYLIEVLVGSESNLLANVRLRVTSLSGTDPEQIITGITYGVSTPIGSRGASIVFTADGSTPGDFTDDFKTGNSWSWAITQAYTSPTITPAGSYSGATSTTYVVTVTRGGKWTDPAAANRPEITVSTTDATDAGVPVVVGATAVPIGTKGVSFTFSAGNAVLVAGDQWTLDATAVAIGDVNELILANTLPTAFRGVDLQVELAIIGDLEIPANRLSSPPNKNWVTSATALTLQAGITTTHQRGGALALSVVAGDAVIDTRALNTAIANKTHDVADESTAQSLVGADLVDGVLGYGVRRALAMASGMVVKVLPIASDDLAGYQAALATLKDRDDFYRIVPQTHDESVHAAVDAEINRRSTATAGRWATAMYGKALVTEKAIIGGPDQTQSFATITDPLGGTQYNRLHDVDGQFITKGIIPGDIVRAKYTSDGFGGTTYSTFTVDSVVSEEDINLVESATTPSGVPSLYEIWHPMTVDEQADDYGRRAAHHANRRVTVVFPPNPGRGGVKVANYFLAAGLAAYRGASLPHQGLTNAEVTDWDDFSESTVTFANQLDRIANYGVYIVTQTPDGVAFIRKQLTTDLSDTKKAEDSATVNVDSISYYFLSLLGRYIGKANVVPSALKLIETSINRGIEHLVTDTATDELGGQLTDAEIQYIRPHAVLLDRVVVRINATIPIPLNNGEMDLVV
jgi:hypothetical protein